MLLKNEAEKTLKSLSTKENLNIDLLESLDENSMLKVKPSLWESWDFDRNNNISLNIFKVTKGLAKKAWWLCSKCNSSYDMAINKKVNNRGCPFCAGYRINNTNSLASKNPLLAAQWHPIKNGDLAPDQIACGNTKKVWWLGDCGHEWQATTHNRFQGNTSCPYCIHNPKVLLNFNDLWTTHPNIAKLLKNPKQGYLSTFGSNKKVKWICPDCSNENTNTIHSLHRRNANCKKCSDSLSLGEKVIYAILKKKEIEFSHELSFSWANDKRYDFYVPSLSMIIEAHGEQHYIQSNRGKRSLAEEQENDTIKEFLALDNDIQNYIVIDSRHSDIDWIKNSIMKSSLKDILELTEDIFENLDVRHNLLTLETWNYWNSGLRVMQISVKTKISKNAVRRYLKMGNSLGFCDYKTENRYDKTRKSILKINDSGEIVSKYISLKEANDDLDTHIKPNKFPFNKMNKSKGHYWVYEEEYLSFKEIIS